MSRPSALAPFRHKAFRTLWAATLVSNFGGLVQAVGAAWMMTQLTDSATLVALVQASNTLPIMLFALLSGALVAEVVDAPSEKLRDHLAQVGLTGLSLDSSTTDADGVASFGGGLLVVGLHVDYRRQVPYRSDGLRVSMAVEEVRAASFRITYEMHDGPAEADPVAVRAWTRMATFDLEAGRPRRLTPKEGEFLDRWTVA